MTGVEADPVVGDRPATTWPAVRATATPDHGLAAACRADVAQALLGDPVTPAARRRRRARSPSAGRSRGTSIVAGADGRGEVVERGGQAGRAQARRVDVDQQRAQRRRCWPGPWRPRVGAARPAPCWPCRRPRAAAARRRRTTSRPAPAPRRRAASPRSAAAPRPRRRRRAPAAPPAASWARRSRSSSRHSIGQQQHDEQQQAGQRDPGEAAPQLPGARGHRVVRGSTSRRAAAARTASRPGGRPPAACPAPLVDGSPAGCRSLTSARVVGSVSTDRSSSPRANVWPMIRGSSEYRMRPSGAPDLDPDDRRAEDLGAHHRVDAGHRRRRARQQRRPRGPAGRRRRPAGRWSARRR